MWLRIGLWQAMPLLLAVAAGMLYTVGLAQVALLAARVGPAPASWLLLGRDPAHQRRPSPPAL